MEENTRFTPKVIAWIVIGVLLAGGLAYYIFKKEKTAPTTEVPQDTNVLVPSIKPDENNEYVKENPTIFTEESLKPANFNGNFRMFSISCGPNCLSYYALDLQTGRVYKIPISSETNAQFSLDTADVYFSANGNDYAYTMTPNGFAGGQVKIPEPVYYK